MAIHQFCTKHVNRKRRKLLLWADLLIGLKSMKNINFDRISILDHLEWFSLLVVLLCSFEFWNSSQLVLVQNYYHNFISIWNLWVIFICRMAEKATSVPWETLNLLMRLWSYGIMELRQTTVVQASTISAFWIALPLVLNMRARCAIRAGNSPSLELDGNVPNAAITICVQFAIMATNIICVIGIVF